jgi:hypothetical protein
MKSGKPKKAPKVPKYDMKKNYMKEYSNNDVRTKKQQGNPQWPMSKKKLSK